ncbi:hypothetical protein L1987_66279 [Smallanthus sonchifolius]|uniref:Uncharacterized protein n=1 Tax=Smallanthus sonchifolius TaxID=185202 RepID=A0ACB9BWP1_9ASTR|nr:hypothetical protein L1987_66279 [Smallanthus sonchifolius]
MRDDDSVLTSTPKPLNHTKTETLDSRIFGRGRYKFWALAAIILLAFWSMLTGTVTLRFSAGNLNQFSDDFAGGSSIGDDFDILEIEEREKVVEHMWDVYINSHRIKLQRFWQKAFVAAYEDLTSDAPEVREAAITEIATMSFHSVDLDLPPRQSTNLQELSLREPQQNKAFMSRGRKL